MKVGGRPLVSALVVLLILTCFAALPIPLWTCRVCRGVTRRLQSQGVPVEAARVGCPPCRDRSRTTLVNRFRYRHVDPAVRALIQEGPGRQVTADPSLSGFELLLHRNAAPAISGSLPFYASRARFARHEDVDFVVALVNQTAFSIPGDCRVEAWLFDLEGNLLDRVEGNCSTRLGSLALAFTESSPSDGAVVRIEGWDGFVKREFFGSFELTHQGRTSTVTPRGNWMTEGLSRLAIRNRAFHVLPPPARVPE